MDYTATDLEPEHKVAYFREDLGINLHHWHWHLVYPFDAALSIVNKDRRGELFYYMHEQIMARWAGPEAPLCKDCCFYLLCRLFIQPRRRGDIGAKARGKEYSNLTESY